MIDACDRCAFALEPEDLRCALCGKATAAPHAPVVTKARAEVLRCVGCGAAVTYSVEHAAPRCAFCNATMKLEAIVDPVDQANALVPFAVDPATAQASLKAWLGSRGFFRPSDLATASTVEDLRPIWWPAWVFDVSAEVCWTADSNAGARRARWAPHSGQCVMDFANIVLTASRGLTDEECRALIPAYDLDRVVGVEEGERAGPDGSLLERFDVQRSAARRRIVEAIEDTAVARVQATQVPGGTYRNVRAAVMLEGLTTDRYALPAYVLAYRYGKKLYRVVIHGQDPARIVGTSPLSWLRVAGVALAVALLVAIVVVPLLGESPPPPETSPDYNPPPTAPAPAFPAAPTAPTPRIDRTDARCFVIEASANSAGTSAVFARRHLQGGGPTWEAIMHRVMVRRLTVTDANVEATADAPRFGSHFAVRLGRKATWVLLDDEGDAATVCAGDPGVRDLLRAEYDRLNGSASALRRLLGHGDDIE